MKRFRKHDQGSENSGQGTEKQDQVRPGAKGPINKPEEGTEKQDQITFSSLLSYCRN